MKKEKISWLSILFCIYGVFTVLQNLFEMKTIGSNELAIMGGGTIISWIPFMMGDIITEVYGEKTSIKSFTIAGIINVVTVIFAQIVIWLPGTYAEQNEAFAQVFSNGPRTAIASFVAFWVGNFLNTRVMASMKRKSRNKRKRFSFFIRAVLSTLVGQFVDNGLFLVLALAPFGLSAFEMTWADILNVTITGTLIECVIESALVPLITIPLSEYIEYSNDFT